MSHEITETDTVLLRKPAWHSIGVIDPGQTLEDVRNHPGLNWQVVERPLYVQNAEGDYVEVSPEAHGIDKRAYVREDNDHIMGVHTSNWVPAQWEDKCDFGSAIIDAGAGDVVVESALTLKGGRVSVLVMALEGTGITFAGTGDKPYMAITDSHDGSRALRVTPSHIVAVCANTVRMMDAAADQFAAIRHTANSTQRIAEAREAIEMVFTDAENFSAQIERMCNTAIPSGTMGKLAEHLFPTMVDGEQKEGRGLTRATNMQEGLLSVWTDSSLVDPATKDTVWGAHMAVNSHRSWKRSVHGEKANPNARAERQLLDAFDGRQDREFATVDDFLADVLGTKTLVSA